MWESQISMDKLEKLFSEFKDKYLDKYDEYMSNYIQSYFYGLIGEREIYTELLQIYNELGMVSREDSHYYAYLDMIKNNFDIGCNILEVASGSIPFLANIMAKEQLNIGRGTVTIYEPYLIDTTPKYNNMKLYREEFTNEVDISKFDLVVSVMPCLATDIVLNSVFKNNKDFFLAFCGCNHHEFNPFYACEPSYVYYLEDVDRLNRTYNLGDIVCDKLDSKYEANYPIIYNKRK